MAMEKVQKILVWGDNRHMAPGEVVAAVIEIKETPNGTVATIKPNEKNKKEVAAAVAKANAGFIGSW